MTTNQTGGETRPTGQLALARVRDLGDLHARKPSAGWRLRNLFQHRRGLPALAAALAVGKVFGTVTVRGTLHGQVYRPDWAALPPDLVIRLKVALQARVDLTAEQFAAAKADIAGWPTDVREFLRFFGGQVTDYGLLSTRLVTDTGVAFIVDAFQNLTELENLKFHGYGTGTTAESAAQTALVTELTTQYASDNVRPTGTTTEGASANIFRTVATLSPDSGGTIAITEHAVFSQAATGGGTMLDRSVFSAINLVAGSDSLATTFDLTVASGG